LQRLPPRAPSSSHHVRNPLLPATSTTCFCSVRSLSSIYSCIKIMSLFLLNMLVRNACLYLCESVVCYCRRALWSICILLKLSVVHIWV
jgi:hypothetical protein